MTTASFAKFIKEERSRLGLTQTELAEKLYISTAAVSKWERGKCLPDVGKLDAIAEVLGLSVLEVLRCQRQDEDTAPPPVETAPQETANVQMVVYRETMALASKQAKHRRKRAVCWVAGLLLALSLLYWFPVYHMAQVWLPSYFTTGQISKLAFRGTPEDLRLAAEVLELAERACEDIGLTHQQAQEKYGVLRRFCHDIDSYPNVVEERHQFQLWSAHFNNSEGWMWVYYSQEGLDAKGETVTGSWNIPSLWRLERDPSGAWQVANIIEHP